MGQLQGCGPGLFLQEKSRQALLMDISTRCRIDKVICIRNEFIVFLLHKDNNFPIGCRQRWGTSSKFEPFESNLQNNAHTVSQLFFGGF